MARRLSTLALIALLVLGALTGFVREFSGDFHYHVVLGQKTLATHHVYRVDDLSHTLTGQPMFVSAWLGDVLLALAWDAGGYLGCYLLRALCLVLMLLLLAREMERCGLSRAASAALLTLLLAQSFFVFYLRPEMIAFAVYAGVLYLLGQSARETERDARPWRLAAVCGLLVLWANLHGSSVIGLLAVGAWSLDQGVRALVGKPVDRRRLARALCLQVLAAAATCLNPETWRAALAFRVMRPTYLAHTTEWLPMHLGQLTPILSIALAAVVITTLLAGKRVSPWRALQVLALAILSARYRRFATFALIAAAPLMAGNLAAIRDRLAAGERARTWRRLGALLGAGCAAWGLATLIVGRDLVHEIGTGVDPQAYPEEACAFARQHPPTGKMLNSFDLGSYLMYCQPQPVFIDQRSWSLYPEPFYAAYLRSVDTPLTFATLIRDHDIGWAFVAYDPLAHRLSSHPQFKLVYFDDRALIYARTSDPLPDLSELDPWHLDALLAAGADQLARARAQLAIQDRRCAGCYHTELARAALATAAGDEPGFDAAWARIVRQPPTWEAAYLAGRHALKLGQPERAAQWLATIPELGGDPRLAQLPAVSPADATQK